MEIKDYEDDLQESEYQYFSGAIIVISMIAMCAMMVMLSMIGVMR